MINTPRASSSKAAARCSGCGSATPRPRRPPLDPRSDPRRAPPPSLLPGQKRLAGGTGGGGWRGRAALRDRGPGAEHRGAAGAAERAAAAAAATASWRIEEDG